MSLEDFIIVVYGCVDDQLKAWLGPQRLRQRGFAPLLSDSEAITRVVVGEFLGDDTDTQIWTYFRQHWAAWFPGLRSRSRFARQAANLWVATPALQERLNRVLGVMDDPVHLVDGFPVPVCVITRARRGVWFSEVADYGHCAAKDTTYYGLQGRRLVGRDYAPDALDGQHRRASGTLGVNRTARRATHRRSRLSQCRATR
jgi:hypothetical protein